MLKHCIKMKPGKALSASGKAKETSIQVPKPAKHAIPDMSPEEIIEGLITPEQLCQILHCGDTTLRELRRDQILVPKMVRSLPRYRPNDVRNYINSE